LLNLAGLMDHPTSGEVIFAGNDARTRRRILCPFGRTGLCRLPALQPFAGTLGAGECVVRFRYLDAEPPPPSAIPAPRSAPVGWASPQQARFFWSGTDRISQVGLLRDDRHDVRRQVRESGAAIFSFSPPRIARSKVSATIPVVTARKDKPARPGSERRRRGRRATTEQSRVGSLHSITPVPAPAHEVPRSIFQQRLVVRAIRIVMPCSFSRWKHVITASPDA